MTAAAERSGAKIRAARCASGLSQESLGFQAGVHPKMISEYERGRVHPRPQTVFRLAIVLGVAFDDLHVPADPPEIPEREAETIPERFGRNVFVARRQALISQAELAKRSYVAIDTVVKIEAGKRSVRLLTLMALASALSVDPCELLKDLRP